MTDVRRHRSRSVNVRLAFLSQHPSEPPPNTSFRSAPSEQAARGTVTTMFILILNPCFYFVFEECGQACHGKGVEVRGRLAGVCSLFPLLGSQGLNSGCQS